jgi:hypothetical protein
MRKYPYAHLESGGVLVVPVDGGGGARAQLVFARGRCWWWCNCRVTPDSRWCEGGGGGGGEGEGGGG